ncbi:hypothetical protein P3X46_004089 [Hevea brasiliensis]|uniref:C2H2-type domain-containing protein n=1 Tax=Hevea brasiliensis TaxID=3981 RepID=A0ABQ9MVP7_HEVBR|nr:zinc finger protein ZAT5-like [Hevea brasiliensis]KAJ9184357.1 hypothetical protein P3X46_004089 [Hevea brasiliensis]
MDAQQEIVDSIKGKRTKRHRQTSPLMLAFTSSSSSGGDSGAERIDNNISSSTSPSTSIEFAESIGVEEEDMANCLILLAQGSLHHQSRKLSKPAAMATSTATAAANKASSGSSYAYQCKTCNRCFPSFQALGGHRASHKKPGNKAHNEDNKVIEEEEDRQLLNNMSTALSLQMPINIKSNKVHECSICGAEFSSGQALGGHMRRHRAAFAPSSTTTTTRSLVTTSPESQESKKPRNSLQLDLNLPAPEDDLRESNFHFASNEQVLVFSASSLVDCHY